MSRYIFSPPCRNNKRIADVSLEGDIAKTYNKARNTCGHHKATRYTIWWHKSVFWCNLSQLDIKHICDAEQYKRRQKQPSLWLRFWKAVFDNIVMYKPIK